MKFYKVYLRDRDNFQKLSTVKKSSTVNYWMKQKSFDEKEGRYIELFF